MGFNPLSLLLGQQTSSMIGLDDEDNVGPPIYVTANQGRPEPERPRFTDPPPREDIPSRYVLNDGRISPSEEELKEILPRKGMFGVKGTLRDILGTLGDAFLVQGGGDALYAATREKEKMGDAMFGASEEPLQAAERLAALGYTKEAQDIIAEAQQNEYRQGQLSSLNESRKDQAANRAFDNKEQAWNRIARWTAGGLPYNQIVNGAAQYDITPEELAKLGVTPDMTEEQRQQFASMDMTTNQIRNMPYTDRRVVVAERNASTAERNAANSEERTDIYRSRPPQGPQPRAENDSDKFVRIMDKPENQRTAGERAWAQRYREGTGGGNRRGSDRRPVSPDGQSSTTRKINGRTFRIIR